MALPDEEIESVEQLVEALARVEHERWSHWQRYLHGQCEMLDGSGALRIPAHLVARWSRQTETEYDELSEEEKESDREQVRRYLPLVLKFVERRGSR